MKNGADKRLTWDVCCWGRCVVELEKAADIRERGCCNAWREERGEREKKEREKARTTPNRSPSAPAAEACK